MSEKQLTIGILEAGILPDPISSVHGDYPGLYRNWLAPLNAVFTKYPVVNGDFPSDPDECDLWLITGSRFGAYEDHDWIPRLEQFIRDCHAQNSKMIGICFGHQIIAQALGGTVEKSHKGWGLGVHEYAWVDWPDQLGKQPEALRLQAVHQDQILKLPDGARKIGQSDFCEYAAIWYPDFALTVQGHPEFSNQFAIDLLEARKGTAFSEADVAAASLTVNGATTRDEFALFLRDQFSAI